jgi:hypothetical protein
MNAPTPNPYESPQSVTTEPPLNPIAPLSRILFRLTILAFAGFASFFTLGILFLVVAETFQLDIFPSIPWAFEIGVLGACFFLSSEVFNTGRGLKAGFLMRFVASIAVFLLSGIAAAVLVPPQPLTYGETDPAWPRRLIVFAAILIPAFAFARLTWIGYRDSSKFNHTL